MLPLFFSCGFVFAFLAAFVVFAAGEGATLAAAFAGVASIALVLGGIACAIVAGIAVLVNVGGDGALPALGLSLSSESLAAFSRGLRNMVTGHASCIKV